LEASTFDRTVGFSFFIADLPREYRLPTATVPDKKRAVGG
jgi:hypothetical protein